MIIKKSGPRRDGTAVVLPRPGSEGGVRRAVTELRADPMAVRAALTELLEHLRHFALEQEELGSVELVVAEALNNIVEHAYGGESDDLIMLRWSMGSAGLRVRIEDSGAAMPEGCAPLAMTRTAREHAALIPEGGFGWFLITGLARDVLYRREDSRNVLTFRVAVG